MLGTDETPKGNKNGLQIFRSVLEAIIVLALGWTGSSLVQVKTDTAVLRTQMAGVPSAIEQIQDLRVSDANQNIEIARLKDDVKEVKSLKGFK